MRSAVLLFALALGFARPFFRESGARAADPAGHDQRAAPHRPQGHRLQRRELPLVSAARAPHAHAHAHAHARTRTRARARTRASERCRRIFRVLHRACGVESRPLPRDQGKPAAVRTHARVTHARAIANARRREPFPSPRARIPGVRRWMGDSDSCPDRTCTRHTRIPARVGQGRRSLPGPLRS